MSTNRVNRLRLRYSLILIILATLPCYCAGLLAVLVAPKPDSPSIITPTFTHGFTLPSNATFTQFPTFTLFPTWTSSPTRTDTPMASETPTSSLTPFLPPTASDTPIPSPSDTHTPEPTASTTPTPTITETPAPPTETATPTMTNTPGVIIVTLAYTGTPEHANRQVNRSMLPASTQALPEIAPKRAPSP